MGQKLTSSYWRDPSPQMFNDTSVRNSKALNENLMITGIKKMLLCDQASVCGFDNKVLKKSVNTLFRIKNKLNGAMNPTKSMKKR